jgi:ankyrin repeat protein
VEALLKAGAAVNAANADGVTSLMVACYQQQQEAACRSRIVAALLAAGAAVNAANRKGGTALLLAADLGTADVVAALLQAGADVNADCLRDTALALAAEAGALETVRQLLRAGAAVDAADGKGTTALHKAIAPRSVPTTHPGHAEVVAELLKAGAGTCVSNAAGITALHIAARRPSSSIMQQLLAAGAQPNAAAFGESERSNQPLSAHAV